jgi:hypothetical protein
MDGGSYACMNPSASSLKERYSLQLVYAIKVLTHSAPLYRGIMAIALQFRGGVKRVVELCHVPDKLTNTDSLKLGTVGRLFTF